MNQSPLSPLSIEPHHSHHKILSDRTEQFRALRKDANSKCAHLAPLRPNGRCGLNTVTPNRRIAAIGAISATIAEKLLRLKTTIMYELMERR